MGLASGLHAQLISEGTQPFIFQQMDNTNLNQNFWTRAVGVGYFNQFVPGLLTEPESFLHVYSEGMPATSPIPNAETFRTTVGAGNSQYWRMERNDVEIGQLYHFVSFDHFRIRAVQPGADLILENEALDGIRICATGQPATLNGFNLDRQGFSTVGSAAGWNQAQAWSRLHLAHESIGTVPTFAFRPWMRNGTIGLGNSDLFYFGHQYDMGVQGTGPEVDDQSNLVIAIGEDALPAGDAHQWDHISFRFMGDIAGGQGTASGLEGSEMMRIRPYRGTLNDPIEGFVGVGDFLGSAAGPEERLDILDRTIRIRSFGGGTAYQTSTANRVLVADATDGTVYWRPMADFAGQTDCDWTIQNAGISGTGTSHQVYTAVGSSLLCPDDEDEVGIGTASPTGKLTVFDKRDPGGTIIRASNDGLVSGTIERGVHVTCSNGTSINTAVRSEASIGSGTTSSSNISVEAQASSNGTTTKNRAVDAYAYRNSGTITENHGVYSVARFGVMNHGVEAIAQGDPGVTVNNYAIFADASAGGGASNYGIRASAPLGQTDYAGWFTGRVWITGDGFVNGGVQIISDMNLKTNVADLQGASDVISLLAPKTYQFVQTANENLDMAPGVHAGFMAQDVELLAPELVKDVTLPAVLDSLGNVTTPSETFKTLNYTGLIPYMVAAMQEQQAQIQQLQQDLASCCTLDDTGLDMRSGEYDGFTNTTSLENDRLTIAPNPFQERTTLSYLLDAPARVRLQVHTEGGMHLATLRDQPQEPGSYSMTWNTQDLAPGLYYVTLFADGKPVVRKAIKVR